jgi:hypothetical protein
MDAPICPVHHNPMRNNGRGWFCPKKMPDGTWCKQRPEAPPQPQAQPHAAIPAAATVPITFTGGGASLAPQQATDTRPVLAAAALFFASTLWGHTDPTMHEEVMTTARRAYRDMLENL